MSDKPRIRNDIQLIQTSHEGKEIFLIQDHLGLSQGSLVLNQEAVEILLMMDGTRNTKDIQYAFMQLRGGVLVDSEEINSFITQLDNHYLLETENFKKAKDSLIERFYNEKIRIPTHAGAAYPEDPEDLRTYLNEILNNKTDDEIDVAPESIIALAAPHIDIRGGKTVYGSAYRKLQGLQADRVILLGTGHFITDGFYVLTEKDFQTPLGDLKCDKEAVAFLREGNTDILAPDDFAFRNEHSIEFQTLFIKHITGEQSPEIVPILCGSFLEVLPNYKRLSEIPEVKPFLEKLSRLLQSDKKTIIIAGVDFSHVGHKFGHNMSGRALAPEASRHDETLLETLCKHDCEAFWGESRRVMDRYHVCGFSSLATMMEILPAYKGHALNYEFLHEEPTQSAVSFAAAVFTHNQ